jgi:hypothetical protein
MNAGSIQASTLPGALEASTLPGALEGKMENPQPAVVALKADFFL